MSIFAASNPKSIMTMDSLSNKKTKGETMANGKYLNPKADLTFKLVFGEHKDLVMSLLMPCCPLLRTIRLSAWSISRRNWCRSKPARRTALLTCTVPTQVAGGLSWKCRCTGTTTSRSVCYSTLPRPW